MQNGYGIHTKEHLSPYAKNSAFNVSMWLKVKVSKQHTQYK